MSEYYRVNIAGMERDLLRCPLNDKLDIAAFIIFGDVELTVHAAAELLKRLPELPPRQRAFLSHTRCQGRAARSISSPARSPSSI